MIIYIYIYIYIIGDLSGIFFRFGWCRVGVNWQREKRVSLGRAVMHRRATEARRTRRYALPMGIQEEEYGGAETGKAHGRQKGTVREGGERSRGQD